MHVILTGATGLVGSAVLHAMTKNPEISKISILSRRPVPMIQNTNDSRIKTILCKDFSRFDDSILEQLSGATGCVWALGVSQADVNKEEYIHVTNTLALTAARAFERLPPPSEEFTFVYVSGEGATHKPGISTPLFGRVKGKTEVDLMNLQTEAPRLRPISVRPAFVDVIAHDEIKPWVPPQTGLRHALIAGLAPFVRNIWTGTHSPTEPLGRFLAGLACGGFDGQLTGSGIEVYGSSPIISNVGFRRLMRLDESPK